VPFLRRSFLPALLLAAGVALGQPGVTVLVNGKILTMDPRFSTAQALLVRDGRIAAVGSSSE